MIEEAQIGNVTCPKCSAKQEMEIPQNACVPFYKCDKCGEIITSTEKCCVFCEYGDKACGAGHVTA